MKSDDGFCVENILSWPHLECGSGKNIENSKALGGREIGVRHFRIKRQTPPSLVLIHCLVICGVVNCRTILGDGWWDVIIIIPIDIV